MDGHKYAVEYLLNNANDTIKYRLITEVCAIQNPMEVERLRKAIVDSERYKKLLSCLRNRKEYHGATLYAVENSLNMLVDMGIYYQKGFEDFDDVQRMMSTRSIKKADGKNYGKSQAKSVWVKKTRCTCNHAMNRRVTYVAKNGDKSFIYQCYHQLQTGTKAARIKKGLSIDNICENTTFTEWKLEVQADFLFKKLVRNKQAIYDTAMEMIGEIHSIKNTKSVEKDKIVSNIKEIDKLKGKIAVLVDLCAEGDISREVFRDKKQKIEDQILQLEQSNNEHRQKILDAEKDSIVEDRMKGLAEFIQMKAFDAKRKIPSTIIDQYVEQIIFDKGVFTWILNPALGNQYQRLSIDTSGMKKNQTSPKLLCCADTSTCCN